MRTFGANPVMETARRRLLEADSLHLPVRERLERALKRARSSTGGIELIHVQSDVLSDAVEYLENVLEAKEAALPMARIILPPRTGKTVIAAKLVELTGLTAVFCVPSLTLLDQVRREFERRLPSVPIGIYSGERKEVVANGVNITTYQSLQRRTSEEIPLEIRTAALIFPDEAHRAMTELRSGVLRNAFDPLAIRIALTGTPDYSEERALVKYFPDLIHEVTLEEGIKLGLLARVKAVPLRIRYGSAPLRVVAGDYEQGELGQVMSHVAMLQAVHQVRYAEEYRELPALIACASVAQAMCVFEHLAGSHPEGTPCPAPVHSDVEPEARKAFIQMFREGALDTLIVVGMLLEGFDMSNCRMLIDLSPSCSLVRTKQKYTRVMTKVGDQVGHIVSFLPADLPRRPYLPRDIFGPSVEELVEAEERGSRNGHSRRRSLWERLLEAGIEASWVEFTFDQVPEAPASAPLSLNRYDRHAVRRIVRRSGFRLEKVAWRQKSAFLRWKFEVGERLVSGVEFLQALGLNGNMGGLRRFVDRYFPDLGATRRLFYSNVLKQVDEPVPIILTAAEVKRSSVQELLRGPSPQDLAHRRRDPSHACCAVGMREVPTPIDLIDVDRWREGIGRQLDTLTPVELRVLHWRFGLHGEEERTLLQIAQTYNLSKERIRGIQNEALAKIRKKISGYEVEGQGLELGFRRLLQTQERVLEQFQPKVMSWHKGLWDILRFGMWNRVKEYSWDQLLQRLKECVPPAPTWSRHELPYEFKTRYQTKKGIWVWKDGGGLEWRAGDSYPRKGNSPSEWMLGQHPIARFSTGNTVATAFFVDVANLTTFVRLGCVYREGEEAYLAYRFASLGQRVHLIE